MSNNKHIPNHVELHRASGVLELGYPDGSNFQLGAEFLRVYSPSAEVRGHSPDQAVLQIGKQQVAIVDVKPVGHYALQLVFDDGHDTGLYAWDYLYDLAVNQQSHWDDYLRRLREANATRDPEAQVIRLGN